MRTSTASGRVLTHRYRRATGTHQLPTANKKPLATVGCLPPQPLCNLNYVGLCKTGA